MIVRVAGKIGRAGLIAAGERCTCRKQGIVDGYWVSGTIECDIAVFVVYLFVAVGVDKWLSVFVGQEREEEVVEGTADELRVFTAEETEVELESIRRVRRTQLEMQMNGVVDYARCLA